MKKKMKLWAEGAILIVTGIFITLPILLLVSGSITGKYEMYQYLLPMLKEEGFISWRIIPKYPDFSEFGKILFQTPQFFVLFWNSIKLTCYILIGQIIVALPAAWFFAVYHFRFQKPLFNIYIIFMLLPFQVTMLSNYLILDKLTLINTHWSIILPAVFSAFPVFLMYRSFCTIPKGLFEAARIDGAGEWYQFFHLGIPLGQSGIMAAIVLNFLECWNLIEQPLSFLKDKELWPLSLYLPEIGLQRAGFAMTASILTLLPAFCVFALGKDYLEQGIATSGMKE